MQIQEFQQFFFWCMIINGSIYLISALAIGLMREWACKIMFLVLGMEAADTLIAVQRYLANFKLLITVFNFTPWLVLYLMEHAIV